MGMEHVWPEYAGQSRVKTAFALRSILNAHGVLAFGTDWPTVRLDPVYSLRNAVLRQSLDGQPAGGYVPSERITVPQAIRAYTLDAAFASHREKQEGSLEVGKLADFVVLSNNLLEIKPQEIAKVTVLRTIVGGRQVYAAP
jgi:predicted amidohydrolase YtcJ